MTIHYESVETETSDFAPPQKRFLPAYLLLFLNLAWLCFLFGVQRSPSGLEQALSNARLVSTVPIVGFVGLLLGICCLAFTSGYRRPYLGRGVALAGIFLSLLELFTPFIWAINLMREFDHTDKLSASAQCESNLRQIGFALLSYRNKHDGKFPNTLYTLVREEKLDLSLVFCPENQERYIYRGQDLGKFDNPNLNLIVAYESKPHKNGKRSVLCGDFSHINVTNEEFKCLIQKDNEIRNRYRLPPKPAE